jgi:uncharacterized protein (DUF1800 family)
MTLFDRPIARDSYALIRFGCGYPALGAPTEPAAMLARLAGPDAAARRFAKMPFPEAAALGGAWAEALRARRREQPGAEARVKHLRAGLQRALARGLAAELARMAETPDPFRERLAQFWGNHFAVRFGSFTHRAAGPAYRDEAIRPHLAGRFGDLLKAAVTHPMMLIYLDQSASIGPNSKAGVKGRGGLNENLAREVLELHSLGVGGPYGQADVRELAELLTGLTFNIRRHEALVFRSAHAEPGAETVLGRSYGGAHRARLEDIHAALDDLARHPATARHLSGKLAAHFTADTPDPALVAAMEAAWLDSGGDLPAVYAAMLGHPAAWRGFGAKVKLPIEFLGSALRALGVQGAELMAMAPRPFARDILRPLSAMGQDYAGPTGPDGFADTGAAWVQPQALAPRIRWALGAARRRGAGRDPSAFAAAALGDTAGERLLWAARVAETREEGLALVLASAEFNRR